MVMDVDTELPAGCKRLWPWDDGYLEAIPDFDKGVNPTEPNGSIIVLDDNPGQAPEKGQGL
ncbi:MAG: hypothetical protein V3V65_09240 [Hyphomicrobium sp.]